MPLTPTCLERVSCSADVLTTISGNGYQVEDIAPQRTIYGSERMKDNQAPAVRSLLENDLYKFTMWQSLLHSHPGAQAEYRFVCRNTPAFPLAELKTDVEK